MSRLHFKGLIHIEISQEIFYCLLVNKYNNDMYYIQNINKENHLYK